MSRSNVINNIQKNYMDEHTGLCFAYFSFKDSTFQDLTLLVPLLLKQICLQHSTIPDELLKVKQEVKEPADISDTDLFPNITKSYKRVFVVVDGLDECAQDRRSPILDFIIQVSSDPKSNVKVFVSSRKESDISARFKYLNTPAIELETGKITPDIHNFVQHEVLRLRRDSELHVQDDALLADIVERVVDKSDGM